MGFMDKAKKMAEQAQAKLDEAQQQFNSGEQAAEAAGPVVEYDVHGRPIPQAPPASATPPHGDPIVPAQDGPTPTAGPPLPPTPGVPPTGHGDPVMPAPGPAPHVDQPGVPPADADKPEPGASGGDRNFPSYAPPKLSSGDPLDG
jgi:hypothetical protein